VGRWYVRGLCVSGCVCACVHARVHVRVSACMSACVCVVCVHVCVCACVCMCAEAQCVTSNHGGRSFGIRVYAVSIECSIFNICSDSHNVTRLKQTNTYTRTQTNTYTRTHTQSLSLTHTHAYAHTLFFSPSLPLSSRRLITHHGRGGRP